MQTNNRVNNDNTTLYLIQFYLKISLLQTLVQSVKFTLSLWIFFDVWIRCYEAILLFNKVEKDGCSGGVFEALKLIFILYLASHMCAISIQSLSMKSSNIIWTVPIYLFSVWPPYLTSVRLQSRYRFIRIRCNAMQ